MRISEPMQKILHQMELGIHIVDCSGTTIFYNKAMEKIEGIKQEDVMGRHLLDIFPNWKKENSTLLTVLKTQKSIYEKKQSYLNIKGKKITTLNTTLPLFENNTLVGAVEISHNYTDLSDMSDKIIDLQKELIKPKPKEDKPYQYYEFKNIIGKNKKFLKAIRIAKQAAKTKSSVFIYGETGTGKELFAQSIHAASNRRNKPFIAQNCAAMPATLLEGILFGTKKGAFTGAVDRQGLFEQADGGTLFLDEINSMDPQLQAKILRVLQENYVRRVGGKKEIKIDVRIIAASNESPTALLEDHKIRKDLYYRLNVLSIKLPPLRERVDDIPLLVDHFLERYNPELGKDIWFISDQVLELFKKSDWPGNIRELRNIIEASMNLVDDERVIKKHHLPVLFLDKISSKGMIRKIGHNFDNYDCITEYLEDIEKEIIENQLTSNFKNVTKTAKDLGISRQSLQYKIKKYEVDAK